ncbi:hypothetical protein [[Clostridium] scindens]|nr:hypothetical protein [[Clostridium] scindens]
MVYEKARTHPRTASKLTGAQRTGGGILEGSVRGGESMPDL